MIAIAPTSVAKAIAIAIAIAMIAIATSIAIAIAIAIFLFFFKCNRALKEVVIHYQCRHRVAWLAIDVEIGR